MLADRPAAAHTAPDGDGDGDGGHTSAVVVLRQPAVRPSSPPMIDYAGCLAPRKGAVSMCTWSCFVACQWCGVEARTGLS